MTVRTVPFPAPPSSVSSNYCNARHGNVAMEADEIIVGVVLPITANVPGNSIFEFVRPFKQARRRENDTSIVTAGMRVTLEPRDGKWLVKEVGLCFGGMAPSTVGAPLTEVRNWLVVLDKDDIPTVDVRVSPRLSRSQELELVQSCVRWLEYQPVHFEFEHEWAVGNGVGTT